VVFDFDWSLVDENTDTLCFDKVLDRAAFEEGTVRVRALARESGWTAAIDFMHGHVAEVNDISAEAVLRAVAATPMHDDVVAAVGELHAAGVGMSILSDANSLFIGAVLAARGFSVDAGFRDALESAGLSSLPAASATPTFTPIVTNVAWVQAAKDGTPGPPRVRIRPHDPAPTGCPRCPVNLCKGRALLAMLLPATGGGGDGAGPRIVYVGDGSGDACPSLLLRPGDVVLARAGFPLAAAIEKHGGTRATVREWADGAELASLLRMEALGGK